MLQQVYMCGYIIAMLGLVGSTVLFTVDCVVYHCMRGYAIVMVGLVDNMGL